MSEFRKGDLVRFLPDYEDGEKEYIYLLIEDSDGGRVKLAPHNSGLVIPPIQVVKTEWLVKLISE